MINTGFAGIGAFGRNQISFIRRYIFRAENLCKFRVQGSELNKGVEVLGCVIPSGKWQLWNYQILES